MDIIFAIFGAFLNRVRGGLFDKRESIILQKLNKVAKLFQPAFYALVTLDVGRGLLMWLGQTPGWGTYIGAVGNFNKAGKEQSWINKLIAPFEESTVFWGFTGLVFRGAFWGLCLACRLDFGFWYVNIEMVDPAIILYGMAFPLFVWPCLELSKVLNKKYGWDKVRPDAGWAWAEWPWGGFIWFVSLT